MSEKERKKAERERKRQEARENAEKKKRFSLTPEKKRKLKLLIMQKAADDLKAEAERKKAAKQAYVESKVKALPPDLTVLNEAQLVSICKDLHKQIAEQEEEKYNMEMKIRKQDYEINELTIKVNDIKGKFIKPTLKKVNKTQSK
jgi:troponin I